MTSLNPTAAQGIGNRVEFQTVPVHVDPTTYTGIYRIGQLTLDGPQELALIPSLRYRLEMT